MNRQLWVLAILVVVVMVVVAAVGLDVLGCEGSVRELALCVWMTARADGVLGGYGAWFEGGGKIFMPVMMQSRCLDWPCPGPAPVEPSPEE